MTALVLAIAGALALVVPSDASGQERATGSNRLTEAEIEALYHARTDSARMRFSPADVEFVTGMIGHHAQALIMSDLAPKNGASPQVQVLAARIINAQKDEIALMQQWLRDRGQPVPEVKIDGLQLTIETAAAGDHDMHAHHNMGGEPAEASGHADHAMMPGMLTQAELEELAAAHDEEFDRLFLAGMIKHHGGAVTMVHELFETDGAGQDEAVFKLASDVQVDQTTEIARMTQMLEALD
jgi:uncharacterized protein (DUF305 family)